jgi:hypothetical protein
MSAQRAPAHPRGIVVVAEAARCGRRMRTAHSSASLAPHLQRSGRVGVPLLRDIGYLVGSARVIGLPRAAELLPVGQGQ